MLQSGLDENALMPDNLHAITDGMKKDPCAFHLEMMS